MRSSRFAALALALWAHALIWWALTTGGPPPRHVPDAATEPPPVTWLRLLPDARPPAPPAPERAVPVPAPAPKRPPTRMPVPVPVPTPAPARELVFVPPPAPPAAASAPASTPAPLRLALPPAVLGVPPPRAEALNDVRSNSAPRGATAGLAGLAGTEHRWAIEPMAGEGRSRVRHGRGCVEVHVARNAQLDPFNQSVSPTPKQVRECD